MEQKIGTSHFNFPCKCKAHSLQYCLQLAHCFRKRARPKMETNQVQVQCCFTPTETVRTIRDGKPRTPISIFTQLLSYERETELSSVLLYVHRDVGSIRDGSPGRPPRLSHSSWALSRSLFKFIFALRPQRP